MMNSNTRETVQEMVARNQARQAAEAAELEAIRAPLRKAAEERLAAQAKAQAQAQEARDAAQQRADAERFDAEHKRAALVAWRATGGTEQEFESHWPKLREELRLDAVRKQHESSRSAQARLTRSVF